jgi:hypothetical protein
VDEFDGDGDRHRGVAGRLDDLAGGQRGQGPQALARRKNRFLNGASQVPGAGDGRRKIRRKGLLEPGARRFRETIEGAGRPGGDRQDRRPPG